MIVDAAVMIPVMMDAMQRARSGVPPPTASTAPQLRWLAMTATRP
jgi:hypothetical protein